MPFTRVAPGTAFSHYDDDKVIAVGATPSRLTGLGHQAGENVPGEVSNVLVVVTGAVTHLCVT